MVCPDEIWTGSVANGICPHDQIPAVPQLPVIKEMLLRHWQMATTSKDFMGLFVITGELEIILTLYPFEILD
jgi:hypothetical protein